MTRRGVLGLLAGAGAALGTPGCTLLGREAYRFRMTVEADTAAGIRSGSSVMEVSGGRKPRLTSEERDRYVGLSGEAVQVELPSGPIFVLLTVPNQASLASVVTEALAPEFWRGESYDIIAALDALGGSGGTGRRAELPRWGPPITPAGPPARTWPLMVRFRDPGDPATVQRVDPDAAGVRRILLEVTQDPVTTGIEKQLPWLPGHRGTLDNSGDRNALKPELEKNLTASSFWERTTR